MRHPLRLVPKLLAFSLLACGGPSRVDGGLADGGRDGGLDGGSDAGSDAGTDAGFDAGTDDGGADGGCDCRGLCPATVCAPVPAGDGGYLCECPG